ncbi:zinc finger BED domain-containing protein 1-like [Sitophilus oryzae]|uniref:Zinc finger BED domain-containing protein 1-like n=1 Tax=Sitophilus oryzae TaxID=7048 RepID=A0A6J2YIH1_SITOR|nr:zinc finger BED domain-containing protein 1-like [Sitophilus oryzae]
MVASTSRKSELPVRLASKRQTSLKGFISRPIPLTRQKKINDLILNMIITDLQPFSIVSDRGFRKLLNELEPSYLIPSRPTFSKSLMPARYEEKSEKLKNLLKTADHVMVSTDSWTSINMESYTAITAHFINSDWHSQGCLLSCFSYSDRHTAENIAKELKRVTNEWDISEKIYAISTDNAANIVAATKLTGWVHIPCLAHTINLIVKDALVTIEELITKVKKNVEYFHRSSQATAKLMATQKQLKPDEIPLKLINDVATRWNSTFYMCERIVKLSEPLAATVGLLLNPIILPTEEEWVTLKEICLVLKPFEAVTVELSAEKQVTLSKVILLVKGLHSSLGKTRMTIMSEVGKNLINSLLASITVRFGNPENNLIMGKASFLDPRFKTKAFDSEDSLKRVKNNIQDEVVALIKKNLQNNNVTEMSTNTEILENNDDDIIWQDFDHCVKTSLHITSPVAIAIAEIKMYSEEANLDRKKDPLIWWSERQRVYPWLSQLAKKYLCICATSVPCERIFSKAGQIVTERRNRLKSKNVEKLIFLHCNNDL